MTEKKHYDVYLNTRETGLILAAECVLQEQSGLLSGFGFRYSPGYLNKPGAFSLDPNLLPFQQCDFELTCQGAPPGLLDDYLPDDWGRKVLARLALYKSHLDFNSRSIIDTLSMMGSAHIGALSIVPCGEIPVFDLGIAIESLDRVEKIAVFVDAGHINKMSVDEMSLLYLANSGSGVGGARPKALVNDCGRAYIAKFNRLHQDGYNNARIELACLNMANRAGIIVPDAFVRRGGGGRDALLLSRFDVNDDQSRNHLISINTLLKDKQTQRDNGRAFRYDDIHHLLQQYSNNIEHDLQQLLRVMLFNRMINNTDDHERNFSLISRAGGYQFAPGYDMVPSLSRGAYPVAGYQYQPFPPTPNEARTSGKIFGLAKTTVAECADDVQSAGLQWMTFASEAGVEEEEASNVGSYFAGLK